MTSTKRGSGGSWLVARLLPHRGGAGSDGTVAVGESGSRGPAGHHDVQPARTRGLARLTPTEQARSARRSPIRRRRLTALPRTSSIRPKPDAARDRNRLQHGGDLGATSQRRSEDRLVRGVGPPPHPAGARWMSSPGRRGGHLSAWTLESKRSVHRQHGVNRDAHSPDHARRGRTRARRRRVDSRVRIRSRPEGRAQLLPRST